VRPEKTRFRFGSGLVHVYGPKDIYLLDRVHIGATWRTQLNDLCSVAIATRYYLRDATVADGWMIIYWSLELAFVTLCSVCVCPHPKSKTA